MLAYSLVLNQSGNRPRNLPGYSRSSVFDATSDDVVLSQWNQRNATILANLILKPTNLRFLLKVPTISPTSKGGSSARSSKRRL